MSSHALRTNVLGIGIHTVNIAEAVECIRLALEQKVKRYVCLTGVHGVMEAQKDSALAQILNDAYVNAPDGMPMVWVGKLQGFRTMDRVYGPDLMLEVCRMSVPQNYTHFLYGGKPGVVEELEQSLTKRFPGIQIVGKFTPPFRPLNTQEEKQFIHLVATIKPDIFWVGLSTPKQERFMSQYLHQLETKVMIGVGAAFDIHTGRLKDAPSWIKSSGFQWFHRLVQEPGRLGKRYLKNNPLFLLNVTLQLLGVKRYKLPESHHSHFN